RRLTGVRAAAHGPRCRTALAMSSAKWFHGDGGKYVSTRRGEAAAPIGRAPRNQDPREAGVLSAAGARLAAWAADEGRGQDSNLRGPCEARPRDVLVGPRSATPGTSPCFRLPVSRAVHKNESGRRG